LPRRIGQARAEELLVAGTTIGAERAAAIGLVASIDDDPEAAARRWIREQLVPLSASSLRIATRAARACQHAELDGHLRALEHLYVAQLAATTDAEEGIAAFVEKRAPRWEHR
jgi:enoyl-CoA hydratase/carnithine racemase